MPLVEITLIEGRSPEMLRALIRAVTSAVQESLRVPRETIRVIIREVPATHWAIGGETMEERRRRE
jgi:4-oxalocrotonate tautomerase